MDDGRPPPRCGNYFAAIHGGSSRSIRDNQLYELFGFLITFTMRVVVSPDRIGDQQIARNVVINLARKQGLDAKVEQLRALLHMNWNFVTQTGRTPKSANDNLSAWAETGTVYGFVEPMRYRGMSQVAMVGNDWFSAEPEEDQTGVKVELRFDDAKRVQPITLPSGPFV